VSVRADTTGVKLRQGDSLSLAAVASDVDTPRDELGFTWTLDGKDAGKGDSLVLHRLAPGHHNATVAVSDGETTTTASYGFDVAAVKKSTDWVGILVGVVVLVVALVLVYRFLARPLIGRLMGMGGGQDGQGGEQGDQNPPDGQR
jgi:hypothetical protein